MLNILNTHGRVLAAYPTDTLVDGHLRAMALPEAWLWEADMTHCDLSHCNLRRAHLHGARLEKANITDANLDDADLSHAQLSGADMHRSELQHADLSYAVLDCVDLSHCDLQSANLEHANLSWSDLDTTDLTRANLHPFAAHGQILAYFTKFEAGSDGQLTAGELADYYGRVFPGRDGRLTQTELKGYFGGFRNDQGDGPRGTPTIDGERVYVEGGNGDLTCLDVATGKTLWHKNLVTDFKGGRPGWGYSESPLVLEGLLIVTPGGAQGTLLALDKLSGETVWRSAATKEGAHYSSPIVAEIAGVRQIVQFASKSCFGVTATSGEPLWSYSKANNGTANCTTPIVHAGHVFVSSSYGTGGGLAKITGEAQKQQAEEVYFDKQMANHHGGIVRVGDYMYGFGNPGLMCMNFLTGEVKWKARSVGKGSLVVADGLLFLLGEGHQVGLAEATPEEYRELGKFKIESLGRPSWAHPVVAAGRMYIRNQGKLTAYDVRSAGAE